MIIRLLLYGNVEARLVGGSARDVTPDVAPSSGESLSPGRRQLLFCQSKAGFNPLHLAIMCRFVDAVRLLLNAGSDPSGPTMAGYPPILLALDPNSGALTLPVTTFHSSASIALEESNKARGMAFGSDIHPAITARNNQHLVQILLRFRPNLSVRVADQTPWTVAVRSHQTSFDVIKALSNSYMDTSDLGFKSLYYCGLAKVGFNSVDDGADNSDLCQQLIQVHAGNLETTNAFFNLWGVMDLGSVVNETTFPTQL